jgi:hypothetical protein
MANNKTQKKKQRRSRHNGGTKTPSKTATKTATKTARGKTASEITDPFVKELRDLKELADHERKYSTSRDISKLIKNPPLTTPEKNTALADFKKLLAVSVKANAGFTVYQNKVSSHQQELLQKNAGKYIPINPRSKTDRYLINIRENYDPDTRRDYVR